MGDLILTSLVKRFGPRGRWHSKLEPRRHFVSAQNPTPSTMEPRTHGVPVRLYVFVLFFGGGYWRRKARTPLRSSGGNENHDPPNLIV